MPKYIPKANILTVVSNTNYQISFLSLPTLICVLYRVARITIPILQTVRLKGKLIGDRFKGVGFWRCGAGGEKEWPLRHYIAADIAIFSEGSTK